MKAFQEMLLLGRKNPWEKETNRPN
jgi:hypothetical protein